MRGFSWVPLAVVVAGLALLALLAASFLPFFMGEAWGPLWAVEWWPAGTIRSFRRVGPVCGFSTWPVLLAIPVSSVLVLTFFTLVVWVVLQFIRRSYGRRP